MELKKYLIILFFFNFIAYSKAQIIEPSKKLTPYDVVKTQLEALKKNDSSDNGIKQTWLFAHPNNKKFTGPYERFRIMLYGEQYKFLINHVSHQIELIMNTPEKFIYKVKVLANNKKLFFYEWHLEKGNDKKCIDCWFTTAVSIPIDQGNTI